MLCRDTGHFRHLSAVSGQLVGHCTPTEGLIPAGCEGTVRYINMTVGGFVGWRKLTVGGFLEKGKQIGGFADIHIAARVVVQYLSLVNVLSS